MTRFFEPISASATHIYHSALELSPLSSTVRRQYYSQRHTPLPRVVVGAQELWEERISISGKKDYISYTWSPCGQFITTQSEEAVEIHDSLSFELLSTLRPTNPTKPTPQSTCLLAYSMDGCSIASLSSTSLILWDIQTGGVTNEVDCGSDNNISLVWSLDGRMIGTLEFQDWKTNTYTVHIYSIGSGTIHSPGTLQSTCIPHLWAHGTSFQIMTAQRVGQTCIFDIFEVESIFVKVESFQVGSWDEYYYIGSFSPTNHCISINASDHLLILDIWNSDCLLKQDRRSSSHGFSSDGSLFAASFEYSVCTWQFTSGKYTPWRTFQSYQILYDFPLQFSPTLSSLLGLSEGVLHLWHLDSPPIGGYSTPYKPLVALSHCGSYMVTCHEQDCIVTITNLLSQIPSHIIDTDIEIEKIALTGNVLLVWGDLTLMGWLLTEEGLVDGVSSDEMADSSNSIWTVSVSPNPIFLVEDQIVVIKSGEEEDVVHAYCSGTGEVLSPIQAMSYGPHNWYTFSGMLGGRHNLYVHDMFRQDFLQVMEVIPPRYRGPLPWSISQEGWVKDLEGKHQLWLPVEWRQYPQGWSYDCKVLRLGFEEGIIIKF